MSRSESAWNRPGHRKPASRLAVAGAAFSPDTTQTPQDRCGARVSGQVSGSPAFSRPLTHVRAHARARARTHDNYTSYDGHQDTARIGAGFQCPGCRFDPDTAGHLAPAPDTMSRAGSMREAMPTVTAFIDELRAVFGAESINASIRRSLAGEPFKFHAVEDGRELGTSCAALPGSSVTPTPDWVLPEKCTSVQKI